MTGAEGDSAVRRIVCAAVRIEGRVFLGIRHFDTFMRRSIDECSGLSNGAEIEQGFVDQCGVFLSRNHAYDVASGAKQIIYRCGGDDGFLFSENLY